MSAGLPFLSFLAFSGLFFGFSQLFPPMTSDINNPQILELFQQYAAYAGLALGLLSMLLMYLLYAFRLRNSGLLLILGYVGWLGFGYQLVYREPRYAEIAKAIISFLGEPMMVAAGIMVGLGVLWFVASLMFGRKGS